MDSLGNVYFADFGNSAVKKWTAATGTVSTVISGISDPIGVAVDGGGNLYIAVPDLNGIEKWTATTGVLSTLTTAGLSGPYGVAVDAAGNVYIADTGHSAIRELLAANGSSIPVVTTGLDNPWDLAVDGAGNVYIADGYDNAIKEWSVSSKTLTTLASGLGDPTVWPLTATRMSILPISTMTLLKNCPTRMSILLPKTKRRTYLTMLCRSSSTTIPSAGPFCAHSQSILAEPHRRQRWRGGI